MDIDKTMKELKLEARRLREYLDEQEGTEQWIENGKIRKCPPGLYLNKAGNFIRKNLWKHPK